MQGMRLILKNPSMRKGTALLLTALLVAVVVAVAVQLLGNR
jgi:hypothetical protein